mgnify:CR=1 FL=1
MVRLLNNELNDKLDNIVNYIKESNSYQNYLKAKELINKDEKLKEKFKNIKKYQQEIVKNPSKKKELEKKTFEFKAKTVYGGI